MFSINKIAKSALLAAAVVTAVPTQAAASNTLSTGQVIAALAVASIASYGLFKLSAAVTTYVCNWLFNKPASVSRSQSEIHSLHNIFLQRTCNTPAAGKNDWSRLNDRCPRGAGIKQLPSSDFAVREIQAAVNSIINRKKLSDAVEGNLTYSYKGCTLNFNISNPDSSDKQKISITVKAWNAAETRILYNRITICARDSNQKMLLKLFVTEVCDLINSQ